VCVGLSYALILALLGIIVFAQKANLFALSAICGKERAMHEKEYVSVSLPDSLSVTGIVTVFRPDFKKRIKSSDKKGEAHDFPEIIYISKGSHSLYINDTPYYIRAGEMIIYAPGAFHAAKDPSEATAHIISFVSNSELLKALYNKVITLTSSEKNMFMQHFEEAEKCFKSRSPSSPVWGMIPRDSIGENELHKLKKQLELFLVTVYNRLYVYKRTPALSPKPTKKSEFERVAELLKTKLFETPTLAEIAEECSMSVSKLKVLFKDSTGCGVIDFLIDLKIKEAKRLINEKNANLTEIAEKLGFSSVHYFSRVFKKRVGMSPSKYAKGYADFTCDNDGYYKF
jgi:AraC-like DNA-binding protein